MKKKIRRRRGGHTEATDTGVLFANDAPVAPRRGDVPGGCTKEAGRPIRCRRPMDLSSSRSLSAHHFYSQFEVTGCVVLSPNYSDSGIQKHLFSPEPRRGTRLPCTGRYDSLCQGIKTSAMPVQLNESRCLLPHPEHKHQSDTTTPYHNRRPL